MRFPHTRPALTSRLREVHPGAGTAQLLDHEPPARRRLERDLELPTLEPVQEPAHTLAVRRHDPTARNVARVGVEPLGVICARC